MFLFISIYFIFNIKFIQCEVITISHICFCIDITMVTVVMPKWQKQWFNNHNIVCPVHRLKIHNKDWVPKSELEQAQKELILVADWLGTCPTMGMQATRQELMESLETAEIVHIGQQEFSTIIYVLLWVCICFFSILCFKLVN